MFHWDETLQNSHIWRKVIQIIFDEATIIKGRLLMMLATRTDLSILDQYFVIPCLIVSHLTELMIMISLLKGRSQALVNIPSWVIEAVNTFLACPIPDFDCLVITCRYNHATIWWKPDIVYEATGKLFSVMFKIVTKVNLNIHWNDTVVWLNPTKFISLIIVTYCYANI